MKVIEKREVEREYGFAGCEAIVDHPKFGRILVMDGFGGMDTVEGGCVRWKHGMAITLKDEDTFESLEKSEWNEWMNHYTAIVKGADSSRPILELTPVQMGIIGKAVEGK